MDPLTMVSTRTTPQSEKAAPGQERNSAGGYTFTVDDTARLRRFLVLGTDGGTYYVGAAELTKDNAGVVLEFARKPHRRAGQRGRLDLHRWSGTEAEPRPVRPRGGVLAR